MTTATREFAHLTAPHLPRLHRLGLRLTRHPGESADLVQEALCRAWASWSRFDRAGALGAYLTRILVNAFISRHRHRKVVQAAAERPDIIDHLYDPARRVASEDPERTWNDSGLSDEVEQALGSLPGHYLDVVQLVDMQGQPYRVAAATLGIPLGTVMSRLHRARRLLRRQLTAYARVHGVASDHGPVAA